jgi:hypothetical protein
MAIPTPFFDSWHRVGPIWLAPSNRAVAFHNQADGNSPFSIVSEAQPKENPAPARLCGGWDRLEAEDMTAVRGVIHLTSNDGAGSARAHPDL